MTTPVPPSDPRAAGDDRNLVDPDHTAAAMGFEERVHRFWQKNSRTVIAVCALILVIIVAKGAWEYLAEQREQDVRKAYAAASSTEKLQAFASEHAGHTLAGVALLQVADEAYAADRAEEALVNYDKADAVLKSGPLASRAKLGSAMAKIAAGKTAEGQAALQKLADDKNELTGIRAEAAYKLAVLAAAGGNAAEAARFTTLLMQVDPQSPWAQRAMMLQVTGPAAAPGAASEENTAPVQFQVPGK